MSPPLDSSDSPNMQAVIEDIVRTAVVYGFLRGLDGAFVAARPFAPMGAVSAFRNDALGTRIARQVAEEFLRKVYVEQLTRE